MKKLVSFTFTVLLTCFLLLLFLGSSKPKYRTEESSTQNKIISDTISPKNNLKSNTPDYPVNQLSYGSSTNETSTEYQIEMDTTFVDTVSEESLLITLDSLSRAETLSQRLDEWISKPLVSKASWGIRVVRLRDGKVLYDRNGNLSLKPASNTKLFTVAAAYELLGADFRYQTFFVAKGPIDANGTLHGNLEVIGSGDPTQSSIYHGEEAKQLFYRIADSLVARGLRKINGQIVIQKQNWAESGPPPGWMWEDVAEGYGSAPELLMFNDNCYEISISPGKRLGDFAEVSMINEEDVYLNDFIVEAVTVPSYLDEGLSVVPSLQTGERRIIGTVAYAAKQKRRKVVRRDPYSSWKLNLENALKARGIIISDPTTTVRRKSTRSVVKPKQSISSNDTLFILYSLPLKDISQVIMKLSHNPSSEALLRTLGYVKTSKWSTAAGSSVEMKLFHSWGLDTERFDLKDGSGLSHATYVTATVVTDLLQKVTTKQWFSDYLANLPYVGEPNSTLSRRRLILPDSVSIRAKTGTISGVITLSGYILSPKDTLVFSLLCNNYPPGTRRQKGSNLIKSTQNGILTELAWLLAPQGPRRNVTTPELFPINK